MSIADIVRVLLDVEQAHSSQIAALKNRVAQLESENEVLRAEKRALELLSQYHLPDSSAVPSSAPSVREGDDAGLPIVLSESAVLSPALNITALGGRSSSRMSSLGGTGFSQRADLGLAPAPASASFLSTAAAAAAPVSRSLGQSPRERTSIEDVSALYSRVRSLLDDEEFQRFKAILAAFREDRLSFPDAVGEVALTIGEDRPYLLRRVTGLLKEHLAESLSD